MHLDFYRFEHDQVGLLRGFGEPLVVVHVDRLVEEDAQRAANGRAQEEDPEVPEVAAEDRGAEYAGRVHRAS